MELNSISRYVAESSKREEIEFVLQKSLDIVCRKSQFNNILIYGHLWCLKSYDG